MSGGGSSGGTSTTVNKAEPPAYLAPFLTQIAEQAQGLYQGPGQQYYPGSTVVPFSQQTQQSLDMMQQYAQNNPLIGIGQDAIAQTAAGDFLNPDNEYFQAAADASARPLLEQYRDVIAPTLSAQFARSGRSGGNQANMDVQLRAADNLERNLADEYAQQVFGNYARERQNQLGAAQMTPQMYQAGLAPAQTLASVGQAYEGMDAATLQEDINRFNYGQNEPYNALAQYGNFLGQAQPNMYNQTATASQPGGGMGSGILGGASLGYGLGNLLGSGAGASLFGGIPLGGFAAAPFLGPAGLIGGGLLGGIFS